MGTQSYCPSFSGKYCSWTFNADCGFKHCQYDWSRNSFYYDLDTCRSYCRCSSISYTDLYKCQGGRTQVIWLMNNISLILIFIGALILYLLLGAMMKYFLRKEGSKGLLNAFLFYFLWPFILIGKILNQLIKCCRQKNYKSIECQVRSPYYYCMKQMSCKYIILALYALIFIVMIIGAFGIDFPLWPVWRLMKFCCSKQYPPRYSRVIQRWKKQYNDLMVQKNIDQNQNQQHPNPNPQQNQRPLAYVQDINAPNQNQTGLNISDLERDPSLNNTNRIPVQPININVRQKPENIFQFPSEQLSITQRQQESGSVVELNKQGKLKKESVIRQANVSRRQSELKQLIQANQSKREEEIKPRQQSQSQNANMNDANKSKIRDSRGKKQSK